MRRERVMRTPSTEDEEELVFAGRKSAATKLAEVHRRAEAETPKLVVAVDTAQRAVEQAQAQLRTTLQRLDEATRAKHGASWSWSREIAELEAQLRSSADPQINTFLEHLRSDFDQIRRRRDLPIPVASARLAAVRWGIEQGEALKLAVGLDVPDALRRLRETMAAREVTP